MQSNPPCSNSNSRSSHRSANRQCAVAFPLPVRTPLSYCEYSALGRPWLASSRAASASPFGSIRTAPLQARTSVHSTYQPPLAAAAAAAAAADLGGSAGGGGGERGAAGVRRASGCALLRRGTPAAASADCAAVAADAVDCSRRGISCVARGCLRRFARAGWRRRSRCWRRRTGSSGTS